VEISYDASMRFLLISILLCICGAFVYKNFKKNEVCDNCNIILITIDTMRADHLKSFGYPVNTAPFLESLASKGMYYKNAYASASFTRQSHATMLTGLEVAEHHVSGDPSEKLNKKITTLAGFLKKKGYKSAAFTEVGFLTDLSHEFDSQIIGKEVTENAIKWIKKTNGKYFVWLHLYNVHGRYDFSYSQQCYEKMMKSKDLLEGFWEKTQKKHVSDLWVDKKNGDGKIHFYLTYDSRICHIDNLIRDFYEKVNTEPFYRADNLWVITTDHGQGLGSHFVHGHGHNVHQEQIRTPLIFFHSGIQPKEIMTLARHLDVYPTIVDMIGEKLDYRKISGKSLLNHIPEYNLAVGFINSSTSKINSLTIIKNGYQYYFPIFYFSFFQCFNFKFSSGF